MPLYTITTQAGVLSGEAKATLAVELSAFHSEYASVPKNWVHVVFQEYAAGNGFTAGEVAATAALTLLIRKGRSADRVRFRRSRFALSSPAPRRVPGNRINIHSARECPHGLRCARAALDARRPYAASKRGPPRRLSPPSRRRSHAASRWPKA